MVIAQLRRVKALSEIARLLRIGGRALVYVWAVEQQKDNIKSKYLRSSKTSDCQLEISSTAGEVPDLPVHVNGTAFKAQDMLVPWHLKRTPDTVDQGRQEHNVSTADGSVTATTDETKNPQILHRYYHTFVDGELRRLCELIAGIDVVDSYYDQGNWCVIIQRTVDIEG